MSDPFLKWAGGKRWLTGSDRLPVPDSFERYIEPFLGGGAVFFHLEPEIAILGDVNRELIELYTVMRDQPARLKQLLEVHHARHSSEHYYAVRKVIPDEAVDRAARTLYLNRTCWNGLYRVNLKGVFNVPIGTKSSVVFEGEDFMEIGKVLECADIRCADFEETIKLAGEGDFLFVDPPYTVRHNLNGFLKYNEQIFSWADQERLKFCLAEAIGRGAAVTLTNADHESIRTLYADLCDYRQLNRVSVLSSLNARRGPTTEALFTANLT